MRKTKSKPKTPAIQNPRLVMRDAMGFKFRVIGSEEERENFASDMCYDEMWKKKFSKVTCREIGQAKDSTTWTVLSMDSTAMIALMDRLPALAAKYGCTIRNLK